jgi:hypothetical protein
MSPAGFTPPGIFILDRQAAQGGDESELTDFVQLAARQGSSGLSHTLLQDSAPGSLASRPRRGGLRRCGDGTIDHTFSYWRVFTPADAAAVIVGRRVFLPSI